MLVGITGIPVLAPASWRSEQRPALIVATVQQDGQKQAMIAVAGVQQRRPRRRPLAPGSRIDVAIGFAPVHRLELAGRGRKDLADLVVAQREGGDRCELRSAAVVESIGRLKWTPILGPHAKLKGLLRLID